MKPKITKIKKRSGRVVKFKKEKIERAIKKAFRAVGEKDGQRVKYLAGKVVEKLYRRFDGNTPQVEQIQDSIEEILMRHGHTDVARAYILYRDLHARIRNVYSLIDSDELMENYLNKSDWRVRENSNMAYSLQGLNNHVASIISANYWLNKIYGSAIRKAHTSGDFHIHDLQLLATYCCGWDLYDLLVRGFGGVVGKIECKPARHFRTALGQLVNFLYTLQGEGAGAQAVSSFDTLLAPFIRADKLSYKEVKQAMQEFIFNMNVPTRVGFQTPFSNVTLDLSLSPVWKDEPVIIGGKAQKTTYGDYQKEMGMFNKAFAEVMLEGDAKGRVFTFPIPTYNITRDFDWDNPTYEPIWEVTRKYGVPYFCLTEDTTVYKNHGGETSIGKIKEKEKLLTEDGYQQVKKVVRLKANQIIKIKLEDGEEIKATPNHRFPLLSGELKTAKELSLGDKLIKIVSERIILSSGFQLGPETAGLVQAYTLENNRLKKVESFEEGEVVFLRSLFKFGNRKDLSQFSFQDSIYANNTKFLKTPKILTPSLSRLLGYLLGDGSYYGRGGKFPLVTFTNADDEVIEDFITILKKNFGDNLKIISRRVGKNKKAQNLLISSRVLREFLLFLGLNYQKHREKEIPSLIFETTRENIKNFLLGIFETDGYIDKKGNISFSSTSRKLIQGVQRLLFFLGIFSRVKPQGSAYKLYLLGNAAKKFSQKVGFISQRKLKRARLTVQDRPNLGDYQGLNSVLRCLISPFKRSKFSGNEKSIWEKINYRHRAKITHSELGVLLQMTSQFSSTPYYQTLRKIYENNLFCDKVLKKKKQKKEELKIVGLERISGEYSVVDLSVEGPSHLFLINGGILTHNSNFINSDMKPEDVRSMCCRLRLSYRTLKKRGGGLFGANPLTGSIGVITINMPRIGYLAKNEKEYFARLSSLMDLAKEALLTKREVLEKFTDKGLYPYSRVYLSGVKERFGGYWKNHFSTIGLNGMNESLLNFMGKTIGDSKGRVFALEVLDFMRQKLLIFQKETGEMFNLEATPAEGASYRLAMLDKKLYPKIICANERAYQEEGAAPYYTNSTQLPVNFTDDIFEALDLQDELQTKYTGGTVLHGFLGESLDNSEVVKKLVKKIAENYRLPYFTLTPTFSICPQCGYQKGEHEKCPNCGKSCEVFSRVVGYLRPVAQWNDGKQAEFRERKPFKIRQQSNKVTK